MKIADKLQEALTKATEQRDALRVKLAEMAAKSNCSDLASVLDKLSKTEGHVWMLMRAQGTLERAMIYDVLRGTEAQVKEELFELVTETLLDGAGDTYSGRTNDVLRSKFDGIREACKFIQTIAIRYSI